LEKMMVKESRENMSRIPTTTSKTGSEASVSSENLICSSTPLQCASFHSPRYAALPFTIVNEHPLKHAS
jgi:hypothetical protein